MKLPVLHEEVRGKLHDDLLAVRPVAITCDAWTSNKQENYLAVTAHYLVGAERCSAVLDISVFPGSHTASDVAGQLRPVFKEWGIQVKVVGVVTDNAALVRVAVDLLGLRHLGCAAYTLNLCVEDAFSRSPEVQGRFNHASNLV